VPPAVATLKVVSVIIGTYRLAVHAG
jgi:hypothetical protein